MKQAIATISLCAFGVFAIWYNSDIKVVPWVILGLFIIWFFGHGYKEN